MGKGLPIWVGWGVWVGGRGGVGGVGGEQGPMPVLVRPSCQEVIWQIL